jgi:hypothetical protein
VDPLVRLKHDQREIPAEVKAAALRLEQDLLEQEWGREEALEASDEISQPSEGSDGRAD